MLYNKGRKELMFWECLDFESRCLMHGLCDQEKRCLKLIFYQLFEELEV